MDISGFQQGRRRTLIRNQSPLARPSTFPSPRTRRCEVRTPLHVGHLAVFRVIVLYSVGDKSIFPVLRFNQRSRSSLLLACSAQELESSDLLFFFSNRLCFGISMWKFRFTFHGDMLSKICVHRRDTRKVSAS
jgi:hypothetical protein